MRESMGNFLLVAGVVLGALAAADSKRAFRDVVLADAESVDLSGERLQAAVRADGRVVAEPGEALSAALVARIENAGVERVRVVYPARSEETVEVGEAALGRVLASPVVLPGEAQEYRQGRIVTPELEQIAELAGETLPTEVQEDDDTLRLASAVQLPVALRTDEYVDEGVLERLVAAGVSRIPVRIPPVFDWRGWRHRFTYAFAVALTLIGVLLKRVRPAGEADEAQRESMAALAADFDALERGVGELTARADELDAEGIHRALDPLLGGPAYRFLEGRETIREAHGARAYALVMGPWAGAERKLHRAWSAAVDGDPDEARDALHAARPFLEETRAALPRS